ASCASARARSSDVTSSPASCAISSWSCDEWDVAGRFTGTVTTSPAEEFHAALENRPQCDPAAMDSGLHRAQRDAGHVGALRVVAALDIEQDDRHALVVGDARECIVEDTGALAGQRDAFRVGLVTGGRLPVLVLELRIGLDGPPALCALQVHRAVDG